MSEQNSVLNPVGKVQTMTVTFPQIGEMTIGVAHVDLNRAPEGSELYVHPKEGRLKLEVDVANANALGWKQALDAANIRVAELRTEKYRLRELVRAMKLLLDHGNLNCLDQDTQHNADALSVLINKELG
jgi:hypothetical protein